jgi:hypothetical protein
VRSASPSVPEDVWGTLLRVLAYLGALAILATVAASLFQTHAVIAAIHASPSPAKWIEVERPRPAFAGLIAELGGGASRYAILRREADDARKDVLSWGEAAGGGPYAMIEIYRAGSAPERFIDAASEVAARLVDFSITDDVKSAGTIDSKFGPVPLVDFAIATAGKERRCLGFARAFDAAPMQIAGWYCSAGDEVVNRAALACALDRLSIVSAGGDSKVAELFADAERKRTFCGQRNPILAATPEPRMRLTASGPTKLRGRIRLQ